MAYNFVPVVPLGTKTKWGEVTGVSMRDGERYYFILEKGGLVSLFPADVVEPEVAASKGGAK